MNVSKEKKHRFDRCLLADDDVKINGLSNRRIENVVVLAVGRALLFWVCVDMRWANNTPTANASPYLE